MKIRQRLKKKRRGVLPVIILLALPIAIWLGWQFAEILVDATRERI